MRSDPRRGVAPVEAPVVFALRALGLGDLLTSVPALRALRRSHPDRAMVVGAPAALDPLVRHMDFVDVMIPVEGLEALPVQFDDDDVAVNLHGRGPESTLLLLDAGASRLVAFWHPDVPPTFGFPHWQRDEHEVGRWCRLLGESGVAEANPGDLMLESPPRPVPPHLEGATIVHPGAGAPARRWPEERWASVSRWLESVGERVVLTGGTQEVGLARRVARMARIPRERVVAGRTDVADLAALTARATRVVCTDTGIAHLATALGTPSVVLFGPTSPAHWGPPPSARHRVLWEGPPGDPNGSRLHPGLAAISVEAVVAELRALGAGSDPQSRVGAGGRSAR